MFFRENTVPKTSLLSSSVRLETVPTTAAVVADPGPLGCWIGGWSVEIADTEAFQT